MNIFELLTDLEDNDELHMSRILILLKAFAGTSGNGTISGFTQLAKLDFLLRYPVYLERAMEAHQVHLSKLKVNDFERVSVESSMVRYRFGPWDFRYNRFLNLLAGKGLVYFYQKGRSTYIGITQKGLDIAKGLSVKDEFEDLDKRARILRTHFSMGGTALKEFIYKTFPEIVSLKFGEEIRHEV